MMRRAWTALVMLAMLAMVTPLFAARADERPGAGAGTSMETGTDASRSDAWMAMRTLMPGDIVQSDCIEKRPLSHIVMDVMPTDRDPIGLEVKRHVSLGRPLTVHDVGPISLVHANAEVRVFYRVGTLSMEMQGRALEAGGQGEQIRVLNIGSSRTIRATVVAQDTVEVKGADDDQ